MQKLKILIKTPLMAILLLSMVLYGTLVSFEDIGKEILKNNSQIDDEKQHAVAQDQEPPLDNDKPMGSDSDKESESDKEEHAADVSQHTKHKYPTYFKTVEMRKARSPYYGDNDKIALTTEYPFSKVDTSYYDNTLFIGDSRIEGLHDYGDIQNATFVFRKGLSVYNLFDEKVSTDGKNSTSVMNVLSEKHYDRIYMMIGINELGKGTTEDFKNQYSEIIENVRKKQPGSTIVIMGIMHVTHKYSQGDDVFNNDNIDDRNRAIAELTNGEDIFYLDINPGVEDEDKGLNSEYTWDGLHLKAEYYSLWVDYMNMHGFEYRG